MAALDVIGIDLQLRFGIHFRGSRQHQVVIRQLGIGLLCILGDQYTAIEHHAALAVEYALEGLTTSAMRHQVLNVQMHIVELLIARQHQPIQFRRGTLTDEDRFKINEHSVQTILMLDKLPFPKELRRVPTWAGNHHEKLDGSGYPRRLSAAQLSIPERVMAIADIFEALTARAEELQDVGIIHHLTLGDAPYIGPDMTGHFRCNDCFVGANTREAVNAGEADYVPLHLHEMPRLFREKRLPLDVACVCVSPPDEHGFCSFGIEVGVTKPAATAAKIILAEVNRLMPRTLGDSFIHISKLTACVEIDRPLDFAAVADHAEFLGELALCTDPGSNAYATDTCQGIRDATAPTDSPLGFKILLADSDFGITFDGVAHACRNQRAHVRFIIRLGIRIELPVEGLERGEVDRSVVVLAHGNA